MHRVAADVQRLIKQEAARIEASTSFKLYWDANFKTYATQDDATFHNMKRVWFTPEEYNKYKDDREKRRAIWRNRFRKVYKAELGEDPEA